MHFVAKFRNKEWVEREVEFQADGWESALKLALAMLEPAEWLAVLLVD